MTANRIEHRVDGNPKILLGQKQRTSDEPSSTFMRIGSGSLDTKNDADRYTTTLILPDVITKPKDRALKKVLTLLDTGATLKLWKRRHS